MIDDLKRRLNQLESGVCSFVYFYYDELKATIQQLEQAEAPIDMLLYCPDCGRQHVDKPSETWSNPPHKSHLCLHCGCVWRPSDKCTNGVIRIETAGSADTWKGGGVTTEQAEGMRDALNGWSRKDMPDLMKLIGSLREPSSIEVAYEYASLCCVTLIQSTLNQSKDC